MLLDDPDPTEELGEVGGSVDGDDVVGDRAPTDEQAATPMASARTEIQTLRRQRDPRGKG
jgi:hypothetical protein